MLSIQEMVNKTETQRREVKNAIEGYGYFHPSNASILTEQKPVDTIELRESLRHIPLGEFLAKSGSTGIAGAAYLIPDKVHDDLIIYSRYADYAAILSGHVVNGWRGGDLLVPIVAEASMKGKQGSSGGKASDLSPVVARATLTPRLITAPIFATNDMIEDVAYNLVDWYVKAAAESINYQSTQIALEALIAGSDGEGTLNTSAGGADTTTYANVLAAIGENAVDEWVSDTMVIMPEAWEDAVSVSATGLPGVAAKVPIPEGFDLSLAQLNVHFDCSPLLHFNADTTAHTNCITLIFSRKNAMMTGRKRWMQIENFSNPVEDLAGAVVSSRQDCVTLYNDCICKLSET